MDLFYISELRLNNPDDHLPTVIFFHVHLTVSQMSFYVVTFSGVVLC